MTSSWAKRERILPGTAERAQRLRAAATFTEQRLWRELRKLDAKFRRQRPLGRFVVDFACDRAKLVIEIDGGIHKLPDVQASDLERQTWLEREGYRVLRFNDQDVVQRLDEVMARIVEALNAPFSLEGRRVGVMGARATVPNEALEAMSQLASPPPAPHPDTSANTPLTQPFPPRGGRA